MANKFYSPSPSNQTGLRDILLALQDKYTTNVTVYYQSATCIVFSCPIIADKVIKMATYGASNSTYYSIGFYYGDAWTSDETITNQVQFGGELETSTSYGSVGSYNLILGDNYFLCIEVGNHINKNKIILMAKMTNNKYICIGMSQGAYGVVCGMNTTDNVGVSLVTFSRGFSSSTNKLYKQNIIIVRNDGGAEENSDGSMATITGLYNVSYSTTPSTTRGGTSYFMSNCNLYMSDTTILHITTCLFAELS